MAARSTCRTVKAAPCRSAPGRPTDARTRMPPARASTTGLSAAMPLRSRMNTAAAAMAKQASRPGSSAAAPRAGA